MRLTRGQAEQGGVGVGDATPAVGHPNKSWRAMFDEQCHDEMLRRVRRYARRVASSVAEAGGLGGEACAEELVQDCLTDTIAGLLVWDPAIATLEHHLMSRIRSRGRDERHRALQNPHWSIDVSPDEDDSSSSALDEAEQALILSQDEAAERYASARLALMREHAASDSNVREILEAVDNGAEGKAEILVASGLSEKAYRNARLRLRRLGAAP